MKKFDAKFIKYSVTLFVVSVLLISIGAVSLTRSSTRTDKVYLENASAKTRIEVLSNENLELKQKISDLQSENEQKSADQQRFLATNSILEAEAMIESGDYENAKICLDRVDKNYVEGFAKGKYDKLNQIIKENTEK